MGCHPNITKDKFPKQGGYVGKKCRVFFQYDTTKEFKGTFLRDDMEDPWKTIIQLDEDKRVVLGTESQYAPL